jgi:hypothetical protein
LKFLCSGLKGRPYPWDSFEGDGLISVDSFVLIRCDMAWPELGLCWDIIMHDAECLMMQCSLRADPKDLQEGVLSAWNADNIIVDGFVL